eukprot:1904838-Prymnesium_polylepis.1
MGFRDFSRLFSRGRRSPSGVFAFDAFQTFGAFGGLFIPSRGLLIPPQRGVPRDGSDPPPKR